MRNRVSELLQDRRIHGGPLRVHRRAPGLQGVGFHGGSHSLLDLWSRRQATKLNGVSYPVQRAAAAVYTPQGQTETKALSDYYLGNAKIIRDKLGSLGYACTGGENSPYIWVRTGMDSWKFFDLLLEKAGVVVTPGSGFGMCGEGYIRVSAFNKTENVEKAMKKIAAAAGDLAVP